MVDMEGYFICIYKEYIVKICKNFRLKTLHNLHLVIWTLLSIT